MNPLQEDTFGIVRFREWEATLVIGREREPELEVFVIYGRADAGDLVGNRWWFQPGDYQVFPVARARGELEDVLRGEVKTIRTFLVENSPFVVTAEADGDVALVVPLAESPERVRARISEAAAMACVGL